MSRDATPVPGGAAPSHPGLSEPSRWVRRWAHLIAPGGSVLDVASGAGRHARWLAGLGHPVTALDRDAAALATLHEVAGVATVECDLEGAPWPLATGARFAAVVVTNYLHRPLMPRLIDALAPGGILIYETFAQGNETVGKPSNPAFLLAPGELLTVCAPALRVIAYQDGFLSQPREAYIQRICAVREKTISAPLEKTGNVPGNQVLPVPRYDLTG